MDDDEMSAERVRDLLDGATDGDWQVAYEEARDGDGAPVDMPIVVAAATEDEDAEVIAVGMTAGDAALVAAAPSVARAYRGALAIAGAAERALVNAVAEIDTLRAERDEALAAERAAGRAEGARQMRERAAAVARGMRDWLMRQQHDGHAVNASRIARDIEALPLDEATS